MVIKLPRHCHYYLVYVLMIPLQELLLIKSLLSKDDIDWDYALKLRNYTHNWILGVNFLYRDLTYTMMSIMAIASFYYKDTYIGLEYSYIDFIEIKSRLPCVCLRLLNIKFLIYPWCVSSLVY